MRRADRAAAIALIGICMTPPASGQEADVLGNADIVTLTEAGLSAAAIVAVIEASGTDFDISVAQLAALAEAGVETAVIEAMARTSVSPRPGPASAPSAPSPPAAQPGQSFSDPLSSGAALAQNPLGDDSGPNANDGQCDDTRFENIGTGNSNIVFWEGARYDGRDATDCADLLLQGLIAWRRDTEVAEVPGESEVSTVSDAQQQEAPTLPEGVTAESVCTDNPKRLACWMELDSLPDCYVWNPYLQLLGFDSWSGRCSDGLGTGTVVYRNTDDEGTWEFPYVNGVVHGMQVVQLVDGTVWETPWVNGERHGTRIWRSADGDVQKTPWVNGERHGTETWRGADGRVYEAVWVNDIIEESRRCVAGCD